MTIIVDPDIKVAGASLMEANYRPAKMCGNCRDSVHVKTEAKGVFGSIDYERSIESWECNVHGENVSPTAVCVYWAERID